MASFIETPSTNYIHPSRQAT